MKLQLCGPALLQKTQKIYTLAKRNILVGLTPGADAINIFGLLNPKKLGNFKN